MEAHELAPREPWVGEGTATHGSCEGLDRREEAKVQRRRRGEDEPSLRHLVGSWPQMNRGKSGVEDEGRTRDQTPETSVGEDAKCPPQYDGGDKGHGGRP